MASPGIKSQIFALLSGLTATQSYAAILGVLLVCGMGVPIPEDITLIAAGFLASGGNISLLGALIAGFFGVLIGDFILFTIGYRFGRKVFTWPGARKVFTAERIAAAEKKIQSNAKLICFTARFLPGLRAAVFLVAGIMRVPYFTFLALDGFAALISVPIWVLLGYWFGSNLDLAFKYAKNINVGIGVVLGFGLGYIIYRYIKSRNQAAEKSGSKAPNMPKLENGK